MTNSSLVRVILALSVLALIALGAEGSGQMQAAYQAVAAGR